MFSIRKVFSEEGVGFVVDKYVIIDDWDNTMGVRQITEMFKTYEEAEKFINKLLGK